MLSDAPPDLDRVWSDERMQGAWRFLNRLWEHAAAAAAELKEIETGLPDELSPADRDLRRKTHRGIKRVTEAIEGGFRFNTAISSVMELLNALRGAKKIHPAVRREAVESMLVLLAPIAPHFSEELWSRLGHRESVFRTSWPRFDPEALKTGEIEIPVPVNGKLRSRVTVPAEAGEDEVRAAALGDERVKDQLAGKEPARVIVVPRRLVNIVVR